MEDLLLVCILILLAAVLILLAVLAYRMKAAGEGPSEEAIEMAVLSSLSKSSDLIKGSFATSIKELGLNEDIGSIKTTASDLLQSTRSLERMFEVKRGRAEFGEFQLEEILSDVLPATKFAIRERIEGVGIPDANIKSVQGIVCIDSKFPLENYRKMVETSDTRERKRFAKAFRSDVEGHISKIAEYVKPEKGTAEIAFGFIPSEAIYEYLVAEEQDVLREGMKKGVHLVSPCTLIADLNLIFTAIKAKEISEKAEDIEKNIRELSGAFDEFEEEWSTLTTHLSNAFSKMESAQRKYDRLKTKYSGIASLEELEE